MGTERFKVRIAKDHLTFSCGHFITFEGHRCERLHGHNYRASVELEGPLAADFYVYDFIDLKARAKAITETLDHHMLLATRNPAILLEEVGASVRVRHEEREWSFPRGDCVLLPIENTTAELIARYIANRLAESLLADRNFVPEMLRVEVEEGIGQSASVEWTA